MTVSLQRTALRVGEAPPRAAPARPQKTHEICSYSKCGHVSSALFARFRYHVCLSASVQPSAARRRRITRVRASDCDGFIRGENDDDDDGDDSLPHDDLPLCFR